LNPRKFLAADTLRAYEDLSSRTLAAIPSALERLIYIASTRDYNSGLYHHEGLVARFGVSAAAQALESAHRESFHEVSLMPLRDLSNELEKYMKSSREESRAFLNVWQNLEPYRVAIPMRADSTIAELFMSNVKIALAILRLRLAAAPDPRSDALPPPSPDPQSLPPSRS